MCMDVTGEKTEEGEEGHMREQGYNEYRRHRVEKGRAGRRTMGEKRDGVIIKLKGPWCFLALP